LVAAAGEYRLLVHRFPDFVVRPIGQAFSLQLGVQRTGGTQFAKLVAAITCLAVLALPAAALAQPRWHRGSKTQITVYVEKTRIGATTGRMSNGPGSSGRAAAASTSSS
jgi:hypothetical protein